ncbi:hypothetical protein VPH35_117150 [Triticum aestivum]|uniref:DUF7595 domain-containing protein n=1 Tax=Aegilops tauschii subsp. strangulata TaxID=200361 RepID=A0A453P1L7_AEGTS
MCRKMKARERDTAEVDALRAELRKAKAVLAETKADAGIAAAAARGLREELDKKVTNLEKQYKFSSAPSSSSSPTSACASRFTIPGRAAGARPRGAPPPPVQAVPRLLPPGHRPHRPLAVQHCNPEPLPPGRHLSGPEPYIVAVDVDTMEATVIDLPRGCTSRMTASMSHRGLLLAASVDGSSRLWSRRPRLYQCGPCYHPSRGSRARRRDGSGRC